RPDLIRRWPVGSGRSPGWYEEWGSTSGGVGPGDVPRPEGPAREEVDLVQLDPTPEGAGVGAGPLGGPGLVRGLTQGPQQEPRVRLGLVDDPAAPGGERRHAAEVAVLNFAGEPRRQVEAPARYGPFHECTSILGTDDGRRE